MKQRDLGYFTHAELGRFTHRQLKEMRLYLTDRTEGDVLAANKRGTLNVEDLNRIEENSQYIGGRLAAEGHGVYTPVKTDWKREDWPTRGELERIVGAVKRLRDNFCRTGEMPELPAEMLRPDYVGLNAIEKTQEELDRMTDKMIEGYRYSGTFFSGEAV